MAIEALTFYALAALIVLMSVLTITRRNPLVSALWLIGTLLASAGVFALLAAPFIAVMQVLIYAGAVMVLFIFVIMLINLGPDQLKARVMRFSKVLGAAAAVYFAIIVGLALWRGGNTPEPALPAGFGDPVTLGRLLLTDYVMPFEFVSVTLLAAIVGSLVLAKRKL